MSNVARARIIFGKLFLRWSDLEEFAKHGARVPTAVHEWFLGPGLDDTLRAEAEGCSLPSGLN
jgi:hypothetical protein